MRHTILHLTRSDMEAGRPAPLIALCGARPDGQARFAWFDPEDPIRRDVYGDRLPDEQQGIPKDASCPLCRRIAEQTMRGIVFDCAVRETLDLARRGGL